MADGRFFGWGYLVQKGRKTVSFVQNCARMKNGGEARPMLPKSDKQNERYNILGSPTPNLFLCNRICESIFFLLWELPRSLKPNQSFKNLTANAITSAVNFSNGVFVFLRRTYIFYFVSNNYFTLYHFNSHLH